MTRNGDPSSGVAFRTNSPKNHSGNTQNTTSDDFQSIFFIFLLIFEAHKTGNNVESACYVRLRTVGGNLLFAVEKQDPFLRSLKGEFDSFFYYMYSDKKVDARDVVIVSLVVDVSLFFYTFYFNPLMIGYT